ncbi:MAG: bifunctional phosphoglucose/phosphomannose isomerase [Nanoarchaeota archaeon]|nr:bifunctional phosphoglucose/phosphomannose isomerase [Nanoarchaeota archaeon]
MVVDASNMHTVIKGFPEQCKRALGLAKGIIVSSEITSIVICGMGGSGISGDLLKMYMAKSKIPVFTVRDYVVPEFVDQYTLVVAISYSGNTEETLSAFADAKERGATLVAITSGGQLAGKCQKVIRVPGDLQPRAALGYLFFSLLGLLYNSSIIEVFNDDINEMLHILGDPKALEEKGEEIAKRLYGTIPVVYSSASFSAIAKRWQTQINENAKYAAFHSTFSEMNHNEINSFMHMEKGTFSSIILKDRKDHRAVKRRMSICKEVMEKKTEVIEIDILGSSLLARMMYAVHLADYVSYHLALRERIDPTPVEVIEWLKKQLVE